MSMADARRVFLQFFMAKGLMDAAEVKTLYKFTLEKFGQQAKENELANFVISINANIKPIHLEIKNGICELTEKHFYVLINRAENDITLCSSSYSTNELEYFKKLVDHIVTSDGSVASTEALNLVSKENKLTKKAAEDLLERLVTENWLCKAQGRYCLSVRSVAELDHYIEEQYADQATKCNICAKLVVKGQSCRECDTKLHLHCARRFMKDKAEKTCPEKSCRAPWKHDFPAKESSSTAQQEEAASAASAGTSRKRSARR